MIRGLYTGASGMLSESAKVDAIANNLANVNTAGYKRDNVINREFGDMLIDRVNDGDTKRTTIGSMGLGTVVDAIMPNFESGMLQQTGNNFDVAIQGDGFFTVETADGPRYTRNGSFIKNAAGELTTLEGQRVLGMNGPIVLPAEETGQLNISGDGQVSLGATVIDQLQIVDFPDRKSLQKQGSSLFFNDSNQQPTPSTSTVKQGMKESSNVNVVKEMINLIVAQRTYESNSKVVLNVDRNLDKLINEVGKN